MQLSDIEFNERMRLITMMRKLGKPLAGPFLRARYPHFADVHEELLAKAPDRPRTSDAPRGEPLYDKHQKAIVTAAWLLGASYPQLGHKFGVAYQTIQRKVDKAMDSGQRQALRLVNPVLDPMPGWKLDAIIQLYYDMIVEDENVFKGLTPYEIALSFQFIQFTNPEDEAAPSAYDNLPAPTHKRAEDEP